MSEPIGPNRAVCENCRFFRRDQDRIYFSGNGECRRHAPRPIAGDPCDPPEDVNAWWPEVGRTDWCGEWRRNWKVAMKGVT